jgi:hypothetical protein
LIKKKKKKNSSRKFFPIFGHQNPGSGLDPDQYSAYNAASGLKEYGFETLSESTPKTHQSGSDQPGTCWQQEIMTPYSSKYQLRTKKGRICFCSNVESQIQIQKCAMQMDYTEKETRAEIISSFFLQKI